MTPEEVFVTVLGQVEGLKGKIYPAEALKNAEAPFVFYLQSAESEDESLEGPTGLMAATFEIHCVAQTYGMLIALVGMVRPALQTMQGKLYGDLLVERVKVQQSSPDLKEEEVNLYRRTLRVELNYQKEEMKNE